MHVNDDFEYEPSIASHDPLDDDVVPECPPDSPRDDEALSDDDGDEIRGVASGIAVTASIASDAAKLLPQQHVQEMFQDCFATPAPAEPSTAVKEPKHNKGKHKLAGHDVLFGFACDKESNLGSVGAEHGVKVIRLCKEDIDLECPESIEQLIAQVKGLPGCSIHCSIECKPWSQRQRLNEHKYPRLSASIRKERENSEKLLKQFIRVANMCLDNGGDCSFEWPRFCSGWALPCLQEWILDRQLHSAVFNGCTVGAEADGQLAKKPWSFEWKGRPEVNTAIEAEKNGLPEGRVIMSVYVDDFTLGGSKSSHPSFWKELQQYINLDPFTEFGRVLGRDHQVLNGELVLGSSDFTRQCISLYLELSGKKIKVAPTPHLEEGLLLPDDDAVKGQLLPVAARLVMKLMWLYRTARPDITFAVNVLAKHITIWSANDDRRAARLIGYLSSTVDLANFMVIKDRLEDLHLALYCDADFAGDIKTMKSTSGFVSFALLSWGSRKQSVISRSTTESEFVSLSVALFAEGLPLLEIWQVIHPPMIIRILEDISAVIAIIAKGFSQKLRHLAKTHRVNVASTCEVVNDSDDVQVQHVPSEDQRSDVMTKALASQKWARALIPGTQGDRLYRVTACRRMEELQGEEQVLVNSNIKDASVAVRKGFVQKVYGILVMQLALTVLIAAQIVLLANASGDVAAWITRHEWLLWVSVFGTFSVLCCMLYPANYIVLFTFTAFEAILIGLVSTMFTPQSLLLAAGVTTLIFLALTIYAMQASTDFTGSGPYLFAGLLILFIFGLILGILPLIGIPIAVSTAVYDCLGVLVFSFAVIFDTQLMLGEWGGHKVFICIDDYVFAALNLYLDIINIFLHVLSLFGERR
eukprot:s909_g9.t1